MRVFHQNESCFACPHPALSYEGGREQVGSSHFDKKTSHFRYAGIIILLLSAGCSYQGDINPRNLLLDSRYKTPPKIGLDWLNKNGNDGLAENKYQDLFPEKTTFVVIQRRKGRAFGGLKTG